MKDLWHGKATWMGTSWVVIQTWAVGLPSVHGKALLCCQQTWLRLRSAISAILYVMSHGLGRPSATSTAQTGSVGWYPKLSELCGFGWTLYPPAGVERGGAEFWEIATAGVPTVLNGSSTTAPTFTFTNSSYCKTQMLADQLL